MSCSEGRDDIGHQRPQTLPIFPKTARLALAVGIESNRITTVEFSSPVRQSPVNPCRGLFQAQYHCHW